MTIADEKIISGVVQERRLATEVPGPRSRELFARRELAVARGVSVMLPAFIVDAGGGVLIDVDGNSLIDLGSGIAVTSVGNAAPRVVDGVQDQVERFTHACFMITPYEVTSTSPKSSIGVRQATSTSAPRCSTPEPKPSKRGEDRACRHEEAGRGGRRARMPRPDEPDDGADRQVHAVQHSFGPFAPEVYRVATSYPFRDGRSGEAAAAYAISRMEKEIGADSIACIVVEPIQGEGGFIVPAEGFLPALSTWCRDNGVVFVADEIQTGIGRTGRWFATEHEGVEPDLVASRTCGGLPLSAVTGRAELMDAAHVGGLGGTYGGNPVACAAALGLCARSRRTACSSARPCSVSACVTVSKRCRPTIPSSATFAAAGPCRRSSWWRNDGPSSRRRNSDRQALPRRRRRRPHMRHVRQRAPLPTATRDAGASARGRLRCGC